MKPIYILFTLLFAFTLAACGGGGGGSSDSMPETETTMPEESGPTPEQIAAEERDEAMRVAEAINPTAITSDSSHVGTSAVNEALSGEATTDGNDPVRGIDGGMITHGAQSRISQRFMEANAPISIRRWDGAAYTRTDMNDDTWDVVAYTNQQDPKSEAYATYYAATPPTEADAGFSYKDRPAGVTSATNADGVLVLTIATTGTGGSDSNAQTLALMSSSALPQGVTDHEDFGGQNSKFNGSFHGIPGTFECAAGSTCRLETDSEGNLDTLSGGALSFTPDTEDDPDLPGTQKVVTTEVPGVQTDADYLDFGYWIISSETDDGVVYEFNSFARGSSLVDLSTNTVRGSATYSGPATGLYMKKTVEADGSATPLASGQFRANAELTAYFGQLQNAGGSDTIAASMLNTISGTVSNFRDSGGNAIAANWVAELEAINFASSLGVGTFSGGTATGGGNWGGQFYGSVTGSTANDETGTRPGSLAGTFDAHFANGHVAGSFAAIREGRK